MKALAIAATVVFLTLVPATVWLAYIPGGGEGEPVAILQIEPVPIPSPESVSAPESALVPASLQPKEITADLPPGVSVLRPLRTRPD
jgi:hypothetical protein